MPIWARWLLRLTPLGDRRADVEADLAELYADRLRRCGRLRASGRLFSDSVSLWRGTLQGGGTTLQDLRFGLRLFRKHPGPIGVTLGGLALAIGAVTSVFSIVDATMLRQYGMADPSSVVSVSRPHDHRMWPYWPYADYLRLREGATLATVEAALLEKAAFAVMSPDDVGRSRRVLFVSGGYLAMLGGRPALGRVLEPADDTPGAGPVVVVSHHLWSTVLDADPRAIGRTVWVNGSPTTLVGVLQRDFSGPTNTPPSIWAPIAAIDDVGMGRPFAATTRTMVEVVARLGPGVALAAAEANLTAAVRLPAASGPATPAGQPPPIVRLSSASSPIDGPDAMESYVAVASIFGVLGLVLALACANTANLLLAGAATRRREIGVRLAMGSTRGRLVRQMVSESLMLALIAGAAGYLCAIWLVPVLAATIELPPEIDVAPAGRVLWFTLAVALVCGFVSGLSPARHGARGQVLAALQPQGRPGTVRSRLRTSFVGFQAAVSMWLLVSAALLARTAILVVGTDVGFDADRMLAVSFDIPRANFDEPAYVERALSTVRDVPSVERASLSQYQPFGPIVERERFTYHGRSYTLYVNRTDADYAATAGLRILRGRAFTADEVAGEAPVALVSDSIAGEFFGGVDPIGQSLQALPTEGRPHAPATIIGVVADALTGRLRSQRHGAIYRPISRTRPNPPSLIVRTANPRAAARAVEDAVRRVDPRVKATTWIVREGLDDFLGRKRMLAWLAAPAAVLALVLAVLGVYGVTAFVVGQRSHEVSVRVAIGASRSDVLRLLVIDALGPVAIGLGFGLAAALNVSRLFATELPGISPYDPLAIVVALATLATAALVAVVVPARRVTAMDPATVLRQV